MNPIIPIPKALLGSSCAVRVPIDGEYGGEYSEPRAIENVRYCPRAELERTGYVFSDGSKGMLFIDRENSAGGFELPVGALVSIDGASEVAVIKCEPQIAFGPVVHHWEVEVA